MRGVIKNVAVGSVLLLCFLLVQHPTVQADWLDNVPFPRVFSRHAVGVYRDPVAYWELYPFQ